MITNTAILVGDTTDFSKIESYILEYPHAQIFTLNFKSHQKLFKNKITHKIAENFLSNDDYVKINDMAKNVSTSWYTNNEIESFLIFDNINLGNLLEMEFYQYLLPFFTSAVVIEYIIKKNNFNKIISATDINPFVEQICNNNNIESILIDKKQKSSLALDYLNIKISLGKFPFSFKISRKQFLFFKYQFEKILFYFLGFKDKELDKKSILLLDFNPIIYEDLLIELSKLNKKIILLNTRRPAVWNFHSFNILSKNKCKIIILSKYQKKISEQIDKKLKSFHLNEKDLWEKNHVFQNIFSINSLTLWPSIMDSFKQICTNRFSESIKIILSINELFSKVHPSIILEWAETAMEEKIIIQIAKKLKINSIYLQHTIASMEDSGVPHGRFISHFAHSFLSSKQTVWGTPTKEYALSHNNNNTIAVGSPRHDKFFNLMDHFENKGIILFAPTIPSNISSKNMTTEAIESFNAFIQETCKILKNIPNKEFIVKPHPTPSAVYDITKIVKDVDPNITITYDSNILNLINKCELLITTNNSTVAIEAMMLNKPVISLQTRPFYMNEELVKMDVVIPVTEISDIESTIKKLLEDSNVKTNLLKKSKAFLDLHFINQGTASKNLTNVLDDF